MRFTPNVVIGLVITAIGGVLMLERLEMVNAAELVRYWPVALILFGASIVAQAFGRTAPQAAGMPRARSGGGLFWVLALFVVPLAMVSSNFFPRWDERAERVGRRIESRFSTATERTDGRDHLRLAAVMGEDHRAAFDTPFGGAKMTSVMGSSRLDLRDAKLEPGEEAVIDVFGMMGEVRILVPEGWIVDVRTTPVMGGVKDHRVRPGRNGARASRARADDEGGPAVEQIQTDDPPRVVVRGFIMMGELTIASS